jgi:hypothetical protein
MGELGVRIDEGCVRFDPVLLSRREFFTSPHTFEYIDLVGHIRTWNLGPGTLAFTAFQVPVCYQLGDRASILLEYSDGRSASMDGYLLPGMESRHLFERNGLIRTIVVTIPETRL